MKDTSEILVELGNEVYMLRNDVANLIEEKLERGRQSILDCEKCNRNFKELSDKLLKKDQLLKLNVEEINGLKENIKNLKQSVEYFRQEKIIFKEECTEHKQSSERYRLELRRLKDRLRKSPFAAYAELENHQAREKARRGK